VTQIVATKPWQPVAVISVVSVALVLADVPMSTWLTTATLSLASGVAALAMMAAAAILSGRWGWSETLFGGLDRVYQAHKWLGIAALYLASVHLLFKAGLREWEAASIVTLSADWTRFVRQASYPGLVLIVILALNRNIPYSVWRWWHRLSGPIFLVVVMHWLSIRSPLPLTGPAGVWLGVLTVLAIATAIYKPLLYPLIARHAEYRVDRITKGPSAAQIELEPTGRGVSFRAGQFGFLSMKLDGLREPHPFTIAAADSKSGYISFVIRALGDYTKKLISEVEPGDLADVYAPYGRFERSPLAQREIWVAGGVGISPFLAWLQDEQGRGFEHVTLFYCYTAGRAFPDIASLRELTDRKGVELLPVSGAGDPDLGKRLAEIIREHGSSGLDIAVCGPAGLLKHIRSVAVENGIEPSRIRHERFNFR
jgi:predicted ferric reductase